MASKIKGNLKRVYKEDKMSKAEPLRTNEDIEKMKNYFKKTDHIRDYALFILGINTALRISDLLKLKWEDVFDFERNVFVNHLVIREQKTHKRAVIMLNQNVKKALNELKASIPIIKNKDYIFKSRKGNQSIHRSRAYCIIKEAAKAEGIEGIISCHTMRKTFGYHAWKKGIPPAVIMDIYNHSSIEITKAYLSINQDDRDDVYKKILL